MYNLLILEDEIRIRQGIKLLIDLEELGITNVFEAENGLIGLEIIKEEKIDFVLADINMPKLNGLEFARNAKKIQPDIKIAMITGYDYLEYAVTALKIGVDDYVLKPVSKSDITGILQKLVKKKLDERNFARAANIAKELSEGEKKTGNATKDDIISFIEENLSDYRLNIAMVANHLGFSEGYFSQLFKKLFSITFRTYILQIRLEKSKVLLLTTDWKNYEIANAIGIEDPNYFSVCFKKKYHMTTTEYKKSMEMFDESI